MHLIFQRLSDRKVVHWAIAYLATAWVAIQLVDVLGDQFEWPLAVQQGFTWLLVAGFVATMLTAFLHGIGKRWAQPSGADGSGPGVPAAGPQVSDSSSEGGLLSEGRTALERNEWHDAVEALKAADAKEPLSVAEDLDGLAEAAWWTGDLEVATSARERAVTAYVERGNSERAGILATLNAEDFAYRRADSVAAGWLARAERLLAENSGSVGYGHLLRLRSMKALKAGDLDAALTLSKQVHAVGEQHRDLDLQAISLQDQGRILIALGQVEAGLPLVDEAMACAVSGELSLLETGRIYCNMMETCDKLSDYERASQWSDAGSQWCQGFGESIFPGICRVHRAKVLGLRGDWGAAQTEALRASEELKAWLPVAGEAWYQIGELRLRLGDLESAEGAFDKAHELGREPFPGIAELRRLQGNIGQARSLIDSALANPGLDGPNRARLLPAKISIALAEDDISAAQEAVDELSQTVDLYASPAVYATLADQQATIALHTGQFDEAIERARAAVRQWSELGFPFETARSRLTLARSFLATGGKAPAELELRAARSSFEKLGARLGIEETLALVPD